MTTFLFATTNGVGLGHVTRSMAIARRLPEGVQPVLFTLSQAVPVIRSEGFYSEYLPSLEQTGMESHPWHLGYERRLRNLLSVYDPSVVVFDGTFPYKGLRRAMLREPDRLFVWCRRAMWKPGLGGSNLDLASAFGAVLEPGEFSAEADAGLTVARRGEAFSVPPITYLDESDLLSRGEAKRELGLAHDRLNVLLQLGTGNLSEIESVLARCVARLRKDPRVQLAVAVSALSGRPPKLPEDIVALSVYPLSRYYRAFDLSISAAGYNSFHELLRFQVPTLFVPNPRMALDDQVARARYAEAVGVARTWTDDADASLEELLGTLLDDGVRAGMEGRARELSFDNGAMAAADMLVSAAR